MTWFLSVPPAPAPDFAAAVDAALTRADIGGQNPGAEPQAEYAVRLAKQIVSDGAVVFGDKHVGASLGGHHTTDGFVSLGINVYGSLPLPTTPAATPPQQGSAAPPTP